MTQITTHFGTVRLAYNFNAMDVSAAYAFFSIRTVYVNQLPQAVSLQMRNGLTLVIPAIPNPRQHQAGGIAKEFIVKKEYVFQNTLLMQAYIFFSKVSNDEIGDLVVVRDSFLKQYVEQGKSDRREIRCIIEYFFTEEELRESGGEFYHNGLDEVYALGPSGPIRPHPYSKEGREQELIERSTLDMTDKMLIFSVEINDAYGIYGPRWISLCNKVFMVKPKRDNKKPSGVYIVSSSPALGEIANDEVMTTYYTFEDAESAIGLYKTYEMAKTYGDPSIARKRELMDLEHALDKSKREVDIGKQQQQINKQEADRILLERDSKIKDLQYERDIHQREMDEIRSRQEHLMEMEKARAKEEFEKRNATRKESSEMLKYLPVVLTAIGTLLMSVKAFKGKT